MDEDLIEELFSSPESSDLESNEDDGNESEDTGKQWHWDLHVGMKPSCRDGCRSDDEADPEDELSHGTTVEVNSDIVNLMWDLSDDDPLDVDWLPPKMCKPEQGIKGMISYTSDPRS